MTGPRTPQAPPGGDGPRDGESVADWFRRTFGEMPPPTLDADAPEEIPLRERRHEALMAFGRTIPASYQWARFAAPELAERIRAPGAIEAAQAVCRFPRVCLMGVSRIGKTSLAVAMLRRWVSEHARPATFIACHRLGTARIQHAAGHGEPEIVERAITMPHVLLDDVGCERDTSMNPIADVIFERHASNKPLWITTGLTREQLVKRYGSGVVSRMFDKAKVLALSSRDLAGEGPED